MQKPKIAMKAGPRNRGSVLVGVVAFSIVIAIASAGYLGLTGSTVNHEAAALTDAKAFHAAESGLLIATRWLRDSLNWETYGTSGKNDVFLDSINGIRVEVDIDPEGDDLLVRSYAQGSGLGYLKKRISWRVQRVTATNPGVFINNLGPIGGVGGGGINNIWFDGPFHSNTPLYFSSVSNTKANGSSIYFVNGPVTVFNKTDKVHFDVDKVGDGYVNNGGHWGDYGVSQNDYEYGIWVHSRDSKQGDHTVAQELDNFFERTYAHTQDSLWMPEVQRRDITLPANQSITQGALLRFYVGGDGVGKAEYTYYDAANAKQVFPIDNVNDKVIYAENEIKVLGTVKGKTTVVTAPEKNIVPVGDIVYADFVPSDPGTSYNVYNNTGNYGVGTNQDNIIALVAGGDIYFPKGNEKRFDQTTGQLVDITDANAVLYVTAQMIATRNGHGLTWEVEKNGSFAINDFNYALRAIGSRTIDQWFSYDAGGTNANEKIRFFYDTRLLSGLKAPGVPAIQSGDGNKPLFRLKGDWREENLTT